MEDSRTMSTTKGKATAGRVAWLWNNRRLVLLGEGEKDEGEEGRRDGGGGRREGKKR